MNGRVNPHVLILDDAPAILELLRDVLTEEGYRVTVAAELLGFDELVELAPDLIVLDLIFRDEAGGVEWLCRMRGDPRLARVPVVVCTAAVEIVRNAPPDRFCGPIGLVLKPFDLDDLLGQVAAQLSQASPTAFGHGLRSASFVPTMFQALSSSATT